MGVTPGVYNDWIIQAGGTFDEVVIYSDACGEYYDLTGCTAKMDCKYKVSDASPFITLSTANGRITIDPLVGTLNLHIDADDTDSLIAGRGLFDLQITYPSGDIIYILQGKITVEKMVTP